MRESIELLTRRVRWLMFSISEQHSKGGVGWLVGVTPAKESSMGEDGFSLDGLPEFDFCKHFPHSLPIDSCNSARRLRWKEEMIGSTRRIHWVNHTANTYNRSEGKDGYTIVWTSCVWEWFAFEYHKLFVQNKLFCIDEISGKSTDSKSLRCLSYSADDANSENKTIRLSQNCSKVQFQDQFYQFYYSFYGWRYLDLLLNGISTFSCFVCN